MGQILRGCATERALGLDPREKRQSALKRYHYDSHERLELHLSQFLKARNFGRRLKTLKGLTPYEFIVRIWTKEPQRFRVNPIHHMAGLNT